MTAGTLSLDADIAAWVERARAADLVVAAEKRGSRLTRGTERTGPCPIERDGKDRFAINVRKRIWHCRHCGTGGDVIKLVMLADRVDFFGACEILTGEPSPRGSALTPAERQAIAERHARDEAARAAREVETAAKQAQYREAERRRLFDAWRQLGPIAGTRAAVYLAARGIPQLPPAAALRYAHRWAYFDGQDEAGRPKVIHIGPAMVAAIVGLDGRFRGLHATYLTADIIPTKFSPGVDEHGDPLPAKKVRGSKSGHHIVLRQCVNAPKRLFLGEGIETVLSVWYALAQTGRLRETDVFWSSIDLGNLGGKALGRVRHPTLTDSRGRARSVPSAEPDLSSAAIVIPPNTPEVVLLGDGDSERFHTETTLRRAAARIRAEHPQTLVRIAWAEDGADFNDMIQERDPRAGAA